MRDEEMTMAYLERMREVIPKLRVSPAQRDEMLRVNAFTRALLEELQVMNVAEAFALLAKVRGEAALKGTHASGNAN